MEDSPTNNKPAEVSLDSKKNAGKKSSKKILIISLIIVFMIITGFVLAVFLLNNKEKESNDTNTNQESDQINDQDDNEIDNEEEEEPEKIISSSATDKLEIEIEFSGKPTLTNSVDLMRILEEDCTDPDLKAKVFEAGTVLSGKYFDEGGNILLNLEDYEYFVWVYNESMPIDDSVPTYILFIKSQDDKNLLVLDMSYYLGGCHELNTSILDLKDSVEEKLFKIFFENYEIEKSEYSTYYYLRSDDDNLYKYQFFSGKVFSNDNLEAVEEIGNENIYIGDIGVDMAQGGSFLRSIDGFIDVFQYVPKIMEESEFYLSIPDIKWNENNMQNSYSYDYISIGGCFGNLLEIEDVDIKDLEVTGIGTDDTNVYEVKNTNDTYRKKIYDEDYIAGELYEHNDIKSDDINAFTYEEFLSYHPVFYIQDPFGMFIKFANRNFVLTGGCAKPAIYLYPEKEMDLSVKFKVNGSLTFSYPKYLSGWNVTAYPD